MAHIVAQRMDGRREAGSKGKERNRRRGGLPARAAQALAALMLLAPAACGGEPGQGPQAAQLAGAPEPAQAAVPASLPPLAAGDSGEGLGRYLAGRMAQANADTRGAAQFYLDSLNADPGNLGLMRLAYFYLLTEGRMGEAVDLAARTLALDPGSSMAPLVVAVDQVAKGDYAAAHATLKSVSRVGLNSFMVPLIDGWSLAGMGQTEQALKAFAAMEGQSSFDQMRTFHSALALDLAGKPAEAWPLYEKTLAGDDALSLRSVEVVADFLRRQGRAAEADGLIARYREQHPGSMMIVAVEADYRANAAGPRPIADVRQGLAEALYGAASSVLQSESFDTALAFVRLALLLRQDFPYAQMMVGDILQVTSRPAEAVQVYQAIAPDSPVAFPVGLRMAEALEGLEQTDRAIGNLDRLAARYTTSPEPLIQKGDLLRRLERWEEAATAYTAGLARIGREGEQARHWTIYYSLGIALERGKRWPEAEAAFKRALALQPDQPLVLNYLGYSWIDRGQNLEEGKRLIEKAVRQRPTDGFIVDSMGWAHYLLGDYPRAARELERAVELSPGDPTINEHLGDAYWRIGRRMEARFQWDRALVLKPEPAQKEALERKLKEGLPDGPPARGGQ